MGTLLLLIYCIDPLARDKSILLSYEPNEFALIYKAEVNLEDNFISIVKDMDISIMDGNLYHYIYSGNVMDAFIIYSISAKQLVPKSY